MDLRRMPGPLVGFTSLPARDPASSTIKAGKSAVSPCNRWMIRCSSGGQVTVRPTAPRLSTGPLVVDGLHLRRMTRSPGRSGLSPAGGPVRHGGLCPQHHVGGAAGDGSDLRGLDGSLVGSGTGMSDEGPGAHHESMDVVRRVRAEGVKIRGSWVSDAVAPALAGRPCQPVMDRPHPDQSAKPVDRLACLSSHEHRPAGLHSRTVRPAICGRPGPAPLYRAFICAMTP